jgi:hypothetical protein
VQIVGMEPEAMVTTMALVHGEVTWHGSVDKSPWHMWRDVLLQYALQVIVP